MDPVAFELFIMFGDNFEETVFETVNCGDVTYKLNSSKF